jgi:hypothetical protein
VLDGLGKVAAAHMTGADPPAFACLTLICDGVDDDDIEIVARPS